LNSGSATCPGSEPAKRRRISLACSACRIRKSRCDGSRPRCEPCTRLGFECSYDIPETSANLIIPKDLFCTLEERVKWLEEAVRRHEARLDAEDSKRQSQGVSSTPYGLEPQYDSPHRAISLSVQGAKDQELGQETADGMAIALTDGQDSGFFGASSNIAFMRQVIRAMDKRSVSRQAQTSSADGGASFIDGVFSAAKPQSPQSPSGYLGANSSINPAVNMLPPDHETEMLIRTYFANTGLLFPYIHEQSFLETYSHLKRSKFSTEVRRTWLGLLNMVFAMAKCTASHSEVDPGNCTTPADIFYRRGKELCKTQILRGTTLETVQYLLLTSQYLQGTQKSSQTWTMHGLAVKAALSIGLHSKDALENVAPIEREMRKRTWYGCVLLDRSLSMTFGRPCSIPEEYIRIELPVQLGDPATGASVDFYNATILLYRILWKILANLYGHNLGFHALGRGHSTTAHILQLSQELEEWQTSLPPNLALWTASILRDLDRDVGDLVLDRFRLIITLRYLNTQLLLHRPILVKALGADMVEGSEQPPALLSRIERDFTRSCVTAAEEIIAIVHCVLTRQNMGKRLFGAWWFTLYYTFNAALAVFGSLLIPMGDEPATNTCSRARLLSAKKLIQDAIGALSQLDQGNPLLDRCIRCLHQLGAII
ncbi:hypothetical protein GQ53DRAFT_593023, partial [Thozetella sp. PMI_491]